jgi:hypothetical protein
VAIEFKKSGIRAETKVLRRTNNTLLGNVRKHSGNIAHGIIRACVDPKRFPAIEIRNFPTACCVESEEGSGTLIAKRMQRSRSSQIVQLRKDFGASPRKEMKSHKAENGYPDKCASLKFAAAFTSNAFETYSP